MSDGARKPGSRAPTVRDVAKLAGFSPATVTRALRGDDVVRSETQRRVREAARQIGYRPNVVARALVTQRTSVVGVVIPEIGDSFWGSIVAGIESQAAAEGYSVLLASSHDRPSDEDAAVEMLLSNQVDALIIGTAARRPDASPNRIATRTSVVYVDCDIPFTAADAQATSALPVATALATVLRTQNGGAPYVAFDDVQATTLVAEHLIGLGHERIAFVGSAPVRSSLLRLLALRSALDAKSGHGLTTVVECTGSLHAGYDAANELLARSDRPTAVVAYDDLVAIGVVRAAHSLGLRVPQDVSVVGFDDIDIAGYVEPPLTTVRQPTERMGSLAVELALRLLGGDKTLAGHVLPGKLVVRSSTAPPLGGGASRRRS